MTTTNPYIPYGGRPWGDLRESGLLWLINRTVFHPRGFALGLVIQDGAPVGWKLLGDGTEVWRFADEADEAASFAAAKQTLAVATPIEENTP